MFTVTGTSTAGFNSTIQFRITLEPAITPVGAVTVTAVGAGTEAERKDYKKDILKDLVYNLTAYFQSVTIFHHHTPHSGSTCIGTSMRG